MVSNTSIIEELLSRLTGPFYFHSLDFSHYTDLEVEEIDDALVEIATYNSRLICLALGKYYYGSMTRYGPLLPDTIQAASFIGGLGFGLSSWSAMRVFQLTTQVPWRHTVAVLSSAPIKDLEKLGVRVVIRENTDRQFLTYVDVALMELASEELFDQYPARLGTFRRQLMRLATKKFIHLPTLRAAAYCEPEETRKRLNSFIDGL